MLAKPILLATAAAALLLAGATTLPLSPAVAQGAAPANPAVPQVIPEAASESLHGRIIALDRETRQVILLAPGGRVVSVIALPQIPLNELSLGDSVNMTFTRSVAFFVSPDMNAPPDALAAALAQPIQGPGGVVARGMRISALVVGVHPASHTIDVVDPRGGGIRTVHITAPDRIDLLGKLKPGDRITAVVTETLAASMHRAAFGG